jgi:hypothetical protein
LLETIDFLAISFLGMGWWFREAGEKEYLIKGKRW